MYADDATFIGSDRDLQRLAMTVGAIETRAECWYSANRLMLNRDKTQKIVFFTASDVGAGVADAALLGVVLDSKLCWSSHIEVVRRRLSSHIFLLRQIKRITTENIQLSVYFALIFLLRQIKRITTENIQLSVYFALIHSQLSYGVVLWGNSGAAVRLFRLQKRSVRIVAQLSYGVVLWGNSGAAVRLFRLQKRSVRIVAGAAPRESCRSYCSKYGIMILPCLYIYYTLLEIHRNITSYKTQADNHCYNTRYANNLRIPKLRLTKSIKNTTMYYPVNGEVYTTACSSSESRNSC
ncbi:hypothetical protein QE152_g15922 [Popillia japonica]|uniref:Reverse transcriptase domain-containing protein n=1 Tax=Popillia japonica TaxID=7064 RepID=A0AAW1L7Q9_POPJA